MLGELGRGAFAIVYRARDPIINRLVALKTITSGVAENPNLLERFYREAQSAGSLQHPNIVTIYELGEDSGSPFIAMELVDGQNLDDLIAAKPDLPIELRLLFGVQACRAFDYAHKRGIVHRDIKPANVMLNKEGVIKVVDFGIARLLETSKTMTGTLIGTFCYMAPEVFHGEHATERSDIWSFGVLLYELLAYRRPFGGDSPAALMTNICLKEPAPLRQVAPECPPELEELIHRTLRKSEQERFQTMEDLLLELEAISKRLEPDCVAQLLEHGRQLLEQQEFEPAREIARQALLLQPGNLQARALSEKITGELKRLAKRPVVQEHVEKGRRFLQEGKPQEANAEAETALQLDSQFGPAQELLREAQRELARARQVSEWLQTARQRLMEGLPEDAEAWLAKARATDPLNHDLSALEQQVTDEKAQRQRRARFQEGMQRARALWTEQKYQACIEVLTELQQEFFGEDEIVRLLETAREDQTEQIRQECLAEARSLMAAHRYVECIDVLTRFQREYPSDEVVARLLEAAADAQLEQEKQEKLMQARELLAHRQYEACVGVLTQLQEQYPKDDEIQVLLESVREGKLEREKERRLSEARKLLASHRYEECVGLLNELLQEAPADPEIQKTLNMVREQQAEHRKQEQVAEARNLLAAGRYDECIALLSQLQQQFSSDDEIVKLLDNARLEQSKQDKLEKLNKARKLLASRRYEQCISVLTGLEEAFPGEQDVARLLETARADLAEQKKQEKLSGARRLLSERRHQDCIAQLVKMQEEFPGDNEIRRLLETAREDLAEQHKREKLDEARELLSKQRYKECIALLTDLQQELPNDDAVARLLQAARQDEAAFDRKKRMVEARNALAAQHYEQALSILDSLLQTDPKDSAVLKLQGIVRRESEKHARLETLQHEWEILTKLVGEKAYGEALPRAEKLLAEYPNDVRLKRLVEFARTQKAETERELKLQSCLDEVRGLLEANKFAEAAEAAGRGTELFPDNAELARLQEHAQTQERKERVRQLIERRVRDIKVKINRGELSDAKDLARETLATLGPDTDVQQLLTSAEVERDSKYKKKVQDEQIQSVRALVDTGKLTEATLVLTQVMKSGTFDVLDPRLYNLADTIEAARKRGPAAPTIAATIAAEVDSPSAPAEPDRAPEVVPEYAVSTVAPPASEAPTAAMTATQLAPAPAEWSTIPEPPVAPETSVMPEAEFAVAPAEIQPVEPEPIYAPPSPEGVAPLEQIEASTAVESVAPQEVEPPPVIPQEQERPFIPSPPPVVPEVREKVPAVAPAPRKPSRPPVPVSAPLWKKPAVIGAVALLLAAVVWIKFWGPGAPTPPKKVQVAQPDPRKLQQLDLMKKADDLVAKSDLEGARSALQQAKDLNGPLNADVDKRLGQVAAALNDVALRKLLQQEEQLWQRAQEASNAGRLTEAQQDGERILVLPAGGRHREDARAFLDNQLPKRRLEEQQFAEARKDLRRNDANALGLAADLFAKVAAMEGPRKAEALEGQREAQSKRLNLLVAPVLASARQDLRRGDLRAARGKIPEIQKLGGDPGPLTAEINRAEEDRFSQLEATFNRLKQGSDNDSLQGLKNLQAQMQALADSGGPRANDARREAAAIPDAINAVQNRMTQAADSSAFQQAVDQYSRAAGAKDRRALESARNSFQAIAQRGGPRAGDAKNYVDRISSDLAAITAAATPPPVTPPASSTTGTRPSLLPTDEAAVRSVVDRWVEANESRNADALRQLWPTMSSKDHDTFKQSFKIAKSITMNISVDNINFSPDHAAATVNGRVSQTFTPKSGKEQSSSDRITFRMAKTNGAWTITDLR